MQNHEYAEPTLAKTAPEMAKKGVNPTRSRVSLHSLTNPKMNPPIKIVIHWIKWASLSPMPLRIFSMSLHYMVENITIYCSILVIYNYYREYVHDRDFYLEVKNSWDNIYTVPESNT